MANILGRRGSNCGRGRGSQGCDVDSSLLFFFLLLAIIFTNDF